MDFQVGDRVIYANHYHGYGTGEHNPLVGTKWFCEGSVVGHATGRWTNVQWDNGLGNSYRPGCLELAGPKITFQEVYEQELEKNECQI